MSKKPTPRKSTKKSHAVIGSFGVASVLWGKGLTVRVEMAPNDIVRLVEAAGEYFADDAEAAAGAAALVKALRKQTTRLRLSTEVVIAAAGAKLEPILLTHAEKKTWETASGKTVAAPVSHGLQWQE